MRPQVHVSDRDEPNVQNEADEREHDGDHHLSVGSKRNERGDREREDFVRVTQASYVDLARLLDGGGEQRQCVSGVEEANYVFLH